VDAYVVDLMRHNRIESGFITANYLNVADFHPGDIVNFTWNPDREAALKYLGEYRFEVLDQRNSKLMAGDVFKLMFLREGAPVYCTDLRREGMARDLVNRIQNIRKNRDYNITDHITIAIEPVAEVTDALKDYSDYIASQVLADAITTDASLPANDDTLDIDGLKVNIQIHKA